MTKQKTEKRDLGKARSIAEQGGVPAVGKADRIAPGIFVLFAVSFLLHCVLNCLVNHCPKVIIDEGLYTNIARSLAWEGKLAYRGQPVNYPYLLYPALLVPLYWIAGLLRGDVYRFVQVFNTLLVTSSVFPVYLFAKDFTGDKKKAFFAAVIVACMPDMIMGGYEMAESLIWPLSLWMVFCCYRFFATDQLRYGLLTALFSGLMFAAKPGAIAAGAVMLLVYAVKMIREDRSKVKQALLSLLLLAGIVGAVYGIFVLLFGGPDSPLGLYTKQTAEWKPQDLWVAIEAAFLTVFLFIFACGGIYGILPLTHLSDYDGGKRHFMLSFLLGVLAAIIGTAVFVVPYQWTGALGALPLHLRYCSMFIPAMYVFSADIDPNPRHLRRFVTALLAFLVLAVFPGARAGFVKGDTTYIDSVTLSAFLSTRNQNGTVTGWVLTIVVLCFTLFIAVLASELRREQKHSRRKTLTKAFRRCTAAYFILFMLYNCVCAYWSGGVYIDPTISGDALQVNQMIQGTRCLGITQRRYEDINSFWLESRLVEPMQQVTIEQMFVQMQETDGVYSPFVPMDQSPNINSHETADTDTFVLGKTVAEHLELSESVAAEKTANGHFTVARIQPSERWVDTMMYGMDGNELPMDQTGYIHVFAEDRNIGGHVHLTITAYGPGQLTIGGKKLQLEDTAKTYELTVPFSRLILLKAENGPVQILGYSTEKSE